MEANPSPIRQGFRPSTWLKIKLRQLMINRRKSQELENEGDPSRTSGREELQPAKTQAAPPKENFRLWRQNGGNELHRVNLSGVVVTLRTPEIQSSLARVTICSGVEARMLRRAVATIGNHVTPTDPPSTVTTSSKSSYISSSSSRSSSSRIVGSIVVWIAQPLPLCP